MLLQHPRPDRATRLEQMRTHSHLLHAKLSRHLGGSHSPQVDQLEDRSLPSRKRVVVLKNKSGQLNRVWIVFGRFNRDTFDCEPPLEQHRSPLIAAPL